MSLPSLPLEGHTLTPTQSHLGRNADGTFTKGSEEAKELGAQGGHASHGIQGSGSGGFDETADVGF